MSSHLPSSGVDILEVTDVASFLLKFVQNKHYSTGSLRFTSQQIRFLNQSKLLFFEEIKITISECIKKSHAVGDDVSYRYAISLMNGRMKHNKPSTCRLKPKFCPTLAVKPDNSSQEWERNTL